MRRGPDRVELLFERVYNWLNCYEQPASLLPFDAEDGEGLVHPAAYEARRDSILLTFARPLGKDAALHGAWRANPGEQVPWDCMRLPMLGFYGLPIRDE